VLKRILTQNPRFLALKTLGFPVAFVDCILGSTQTWLLVKEEIVAIEDDVFNAPIVKESVTYKEIITLYMVFLKRQQTFPCLEFLSPSSLMKNIRNISS